VEGLASRSRRVDERPALPTTDGGRAGKRFRITDLLRSAGVA